MSAPPKDERRDEMLLRLLKTPPQPRPKRERGEAAKAPKPKSAQRASGGRRKSSS